MKKLIAGILIGIMTLSLAGCGAKGGSGEPVAADALEIMDKVWASYAEEEKFAAIGGDMANPVDNAPGKFDIADTEGLTFTLVFPESGVELIDDCASLVHMMNANTFTGATYHVKDSAKVTELADAIKEKVLNNQWMCGFPEKLLIVQVGDDYVVSAFGNGEAMDAFKANLLEAYPEPTTEIIYEETIG